MQRERLNKATLADMIRAGVELGLARLRLRSENSCAVAAADPAEPLLPALDSRQEDLVKRVAYVIPRIAARLPWRSDCLVQALAAKRWLRSCGIASTVKLGLPKDPPPEFQAHAWLSAGDIIVTGGDIGSYVQFSRPYAKPD